MPNSSSTHLDELGHNRVHFNHRLIWYLVIIAICWMVWFFTGSDYMWPIWPMAVGLVGLILNYFEAWGE